MLIHLLEDVAADTNHRLHAERIANKIIQEIEKTGTKKLQPQRGKYYLGTPDALGYDATFDIIIRDKQIGYEAGYNHEDNTLHIFVDLQKSIPNQLILHKSHIIHEIVHYFDIQRSKGDISGSSELSDSDYYNNSFETNAFYQEALFKFEKYFKKLQQVYNKDELSKKINSFDKFFHLLYTKFFPTEFKKYVNETNLKRIKVRMYQYYDQQFTKEML